MSLAAIAALKVMAPDEWRWSLFVWGVAVGLAGAAGISLLLRAGNADRAQASRLQHRRVLYASAWAFIGLELGAVAAIFDIIWVDVVITVYVLLVLLAGGVLIRRAQN